MNRATVVFLASMAAVAVLWSSGTARAEVPFPAGPQCQTMSETQAQPLFRLQLQLHSTAYFTATTDLPPVTATAADPMSMRSWTACEARTVCANTGQAIWCRVWGGAPGYSACTWRVWPGRAVECRGYIRGPNGWMWQRYFFRCY